MSKKVRTFSSKQHEHRSSPTNPVIVRHLEWFRFLGSNPLTLEIGRFSEISKQFFILISAFLLFHTIYFIYHLTELKHKAPFSTALAVFRRSAFSLGPVIALYKFVKNRSRMGKALDELVAIQQVFGATDYKMFLSIKIYFLLALGTSVCRLCMGFMTLHNDHVDVSETIKYFEYAVLTMYIFGCGTNFTYLAKCITACIQHLSEWGLKDKVTEPSIRRYVKVYNHLITISEEINAHFDACISFCFLAWFLNVMDSSSDLLIKDRGVLISLMKLLNLGLGVFGILHLVTTGQSATDQVSALFGSTIIQCYAYL